MCIDTKCTQFATYSDRPIKKSAIDYLMPTTP
jgi:hypothetical protein